MQKTNFPPSNGSEKIKILVVPSDRTGVGKFRSVDPHVFLQNLYPNEFHVDIDYNPDMNNVNYWKQYQIVHIHRNIGENYDNTPAFIRILKGLGITVVVDIDDYWLPTKEHPIHSLIVEHKIHEKIVANLREADYVTTTTTIFADEIRKINKNVVIFPNAINPKESQFNQPNEKSDRIRIGWLGGSCLTPDTEILTENGWKYFEELNENEKVATLNSDDIIEYHQPDAYIKEEFDGDIYTVSKNEIDFSVTGNHNMYVSLAKNLTKKKLNYELIQCEKLENLNFHVKKNGININNDVEYFHLPSVDQKPYDRKDYSVKKILMDDWLKIFGFWLAEGWSDKNNLSISVCQFKDNDYLKIIYDLLIKYNFIAKYTNENNIRVCDRQLYTYLSQFGKANEKYIPREFLNNLSERQLRILLDWFLKGDGSEEKSGDYIRRRGYTVSKQLADDLMELAFKIGDAASIKNRGMRTPKSTLNDTRIIIPKHNAYQIGFYTKSSKHNKLTPLIKSKDILKTKYKGFVYCVNVKNNIIYVRRNGKGMWVGNSHLHDLALLGDFVSKIGNPDDKKLQYVLCGFDIRGTITEINQQTGEQKRRDIRPEETVWTQYEKIFTNNYKIITPEYKNFLMTYKEDKFNGIENEGYVRVWTKPVTSYATNYSKFDISLAPIKNHIFNRVKSQLKVIEAGFYKKALIASNVGPYTIDLTHSLKNGNFVNGNALLVDENRNHSDWSKYIKKLVDNPTMIEDMGNRLYETVKDKYDLNTVSKDRASWYKTIIK
jgi:glycosyltransferase involved in cell wall biosynthesis